MDELGNEHTVSKPVVNDIYENDSSIVVTGSPGQRATVTFQNGVTIDGLISAKGEIKLVVPKYIKLEEGSKVSVTLKDRYKQSGSVHVEVKKAYLEPKRATRQNKKMSKVKHTKNSRTRKLRNVRTFLVSMIAVFGFIVVVSVTSKMSYIATIEDIGYTREEAIQLYDACEQKNSCSKELQMSVDSEIANIENQILVTHQLEVANYDSAYQRQNYSTSIEYKNALLEYQKILDSQVPTPAAESTTQEVTQITDENGCYVNVVDGYVVANKKYCMPESYNPGTDQVAYDQLIKMINDASAEGISITILSGYRSYSEQVDTYNYWVSIYGEEYASTVSAKPGYSEHQTGLAFDLGDANNPYCDLEECFESTDAGIWLAQNAHEYGFIIRYPRGSESVTGYAYEPWHFRYVGDIATDIYEQQTTLEEYLQVP